MVSFDVARHEGRTRVKLRGLALDVYVPGAVFIWTSHMTAVRLLNPPLPDDPKRRSYWNAPHGCALALALSAAAGMLP